MRRRIARRSGGGVAAALPMVALLAGCNQSSGPSSSSGTNTAAAPITLTLAVAPSAAELVGALADAHTARTGDEYQITSAASRLLLRQAKAGAPFDLLFAADVETIDMMVADELADATATAPYAVGRLVFYMPASTDAPLNTMSDLAGPAWAQRRIAIAHPELAPYGRAAKQALGHLDLWTSVEARVVLAPDVRAAFQYATTGNVDGAFVPASMVRDAPGRVVEVDPAAHEPLVMSFAVPTAAPHGEAARAFAAFVRGDEGRAIIVAHGFAPPPSGS